MPTEAKGSGGVCPVSPDEMIENSLNDVLLQTGLLIGGQYLKRCSNMIIRISISIAAAAIAICI